MKHIYATNRKVNRAIAYHARDCIPCAGTLTWALFLAAAAWQPAVSAQVISSSSDKPQVEIVTVPDDPNPIGVIREVRPSPRHTKPRKVTTAIRPLDFDHLCAVPCTFPPATPSRFVLDDKQVVALYNNPKDAVPTDFVFDNGGARVVSNDLQLIFFGHEWWVNNAPSPAMRNVTAMVRQVLGGPYLSELAQYNFKSLNLRTPTVVLQEPPSFFDTSDVNNLIWDLIDQGTFPEPDDGGRFVYMVFMPQTGTAKFDSQNQPQGAHGVAYDQDWGFDVDYAWVAWVSKGDLNYTSDVFTHELVESISDPEPPAFPVLSGAWRMNRTINGGKEIGDACRNTWDILNGVLVQAYWSQKHAACAIPFGELQIQSISPATGPMSGGTKVTISGGGFFGVNEVRFGATPAASFTVDSPNQITAISPVNISESVDIHVNTQLGETTAGSSDVFRYVPVVTGVSPNSGPTRGGTTVTVTGFGLVWGNLFFGAVPAQNVQCHDLQCTVTSPPSSAPGTVDVTISTPFGPVQTSPGDKFTYSGPTITRIDPSIGPETGGTTVELYGTGLVSGMTVKFGMASTTNVGCIPDHQYGAGPDDNVCTVSSPPEEPYDRLAHNGSVYVIVTVNNISSSATPAALFNYKPFPYGTMSPNSGPDVGGTQITVTGANFSTAPGATAFNFNCSFAGSVPAIKVTCSSTTTCTMVSPPQMPCGIPPLYVTATVKGLTSSIGNFYYTYVPPPPPPGPPDPPDPPEKCHGVCK